MANTTVLNLDSGLTRHLHSQTAKHGRLAAEQAREILYKAAEESAFSKYTDTRSKIRQSKLATRPTITIKFVSHRRHIFEGNFSVSMTPSVRRRLRSRAVEHGRSMRKEIQEIFRQAIISLTQPKSRPANSKTTEPRSTSEERWATSHQGPDDTIHHHPEAPNKEEFNLAARCNEIAQLEDGWLEGDGIAPDPAKLLEFQDEWHKNTVTDHLLSLPCIYPTPEGGIQLEWILGKWDLSAEIDLTSLSAELLALDLKSRESEFQTVMLDDNSGWQKFIAWVNQYYRKND